MRLYTVLENGEEKVAVSKDGGKTLYAVKSLGYSFENMNELIDAFCGKELKIEISENAPKLDIDNVRILAPILYPKQDVVCLGINYDEHAVEAGRFSNEAFGGERPYTIYFSKRVNRAVGTGEEVPSHKDIVDSLDYESELGVVLKDDVYAVSKEEAEKHILGYTIINDISARNLQTRHKQWLLGKGLDGFTPMGPCIVTPDEIGDAHNLKISSTVNGELRQNSNTKYMIQTVAGAISELSAGLTLKAGTIIATGTPAGVGMGMTPPQFLKTGDKVVCEIENIGKLENVIGE